MAYGHTPTCLLHYDVGVDANGMAPVRLEEIMSFSAFPQEDGTADKNPILFSRRCGIIRPDFSDKRGKDMYRIAVCEDGPRTALFPSLSPYQILNNSYFFAKNRAGRSFPDPVSILVAEMPIDNIT